MKSLRCCSWIRAINRVWIVVDVAVAQLPQGIDLVEDHGRRRRQVFIARLLGW